jgi:hypothetical protein
LVAPIKAHRPPNYLRPSVALAGGRQARWHVEKIPTLPKAGRMGHPQIQMQAQRGLELELEDVQQQSGHK